MWIKCEICNKKVRDFPSVGRRFCSRKCYGIWGSEFRKGKPRPDVSRKLTGRIVSKATREKISQLAKTRTGTRNPFFGKKHTEKSKRKLSATRKRLLREQKIKPWNKNKTYEELFGIEGAVRVKKRISKNHADFRGEKASNWKGGICPLYEIIRKSKEYVAWRNAVFTRDDYVCRDCNRRSKAGDSFPVRSHHLQEFTGILQNSNIGTIEEAIDCKELWDTDNGITLCEGCHIERHRRKVRND